MLRRISTPTRPSKALERRVTPVRDMQCILWRASHADNLAALESGVDEMVDQRFSESTGVKYGAGSTASGSDHRKVTEDEGATRDDRGR